MTDDNEPTTDTETAPADDTATTQDDTGTVTDWEAKAEMWKNLSRKHETNFKKASEELTQLKTAGMSDAEKAIETAKAEARREAQIESGSRLAQAELRAKAAEAGAELPAALGDYVDMSRFIGDDGQVDTDAIETFVSSFGQKGGPKYPQNVGVGPQSNSGTAGQFTRDDLSRMTPTQINQARKDGKLDAIMRGEL